MERAVHRRSYEVAKPSIQHHKGVSGPLGVGLGIFNVGDARHHKSSRSHEIAPWLNLHANWASYLRTEAYLCLAEEVSIHVQIHFWYAGSVGMRQPTAQVDRLHIGIGMQVLGKEVNKLLHIGHKF